MSNILSNILIFLEKFPKGLILINGTLYEVESYSLANGGGRRQATLKPIEEPTSE